MRNIHKSTPPSFRRRENAAAIVKTPPPGALTKGPDRKFPGLHPPLGGATSPFLSTNRRFAFPIFALLAALGVGLLFLLPVGPLQAQNDGMIDYAENGIDAVATFTADDPEDRTVYWSLLEDLTGSPSIDGTPLVDGDREDDGDFMISMDGVLSFKFSPDYEMPRGIAIANDNTNTYKVVVVASDDPTGAGAGIMRGYKKVTVNVTDEDEPGMVTLSAQQGQVGVELTASLADDDATDAQITDAEWKWEHSSAANGPWTAILTATSTGYTPLGVEDKYLRVTATYTDGHGSDKSEMAVSAHVVRAAPANNAAPVFSDEDSAEGGIQVRRKVDENSPPGTNVGKPVKADDAASDKLHYTLTGSDLFDINPATGQITVAPRETLDADDGTPTVTVMVTATDPWGVGATPSGATTQDVIITINDVNEAPVITVGTTRIPEHAENTAIATVLSTYMATDVDQTDSVDWSVSGTDAGDFEISSTGVLTFKEAPNYEMPADSSRDNVYMVTVVATDAGVDSKNKMTAERAVVITVTNEEETGTVTLTSVQPKIGFPLTASVTDLDGGEMGITWKWQRDATGTADPVTSNCSTVVTEDGWEDAEGMGAKAATYTPEEDDEGKCLRATAMYIDGQGMDDAMGVSVNAVVKDLANRAPEFDDDASYTRTIDENVTPDTAATPNPANVNDPGTTTGSPVTAEDPNGDTLTYSLSGNDAGPFMIGPSDGQISAKMKLDHEAKSSYTVTVTATDPDGASASIDVTITVTDMDEAPEIAGDDITKDYPENGRLQVARFTADDPEDRTVYWSLLEDLTGSPSIDGTPLVDGDREDDGDFMISMDGVLSFKFSPDYEMPRGIAIANDNTNTYKVVVVASDDPTGAGAGIMRGYKKVIVNVTNVQETETITLSAQQGQVGVELAATYNDADNEKPSAINLTWKWYLGNSQISGADASTYTPENGGSHRVEASYTKTDGSQKEVSERISVRAAPANNATPKFQLGSNARSVDENSPPGTNVGKPVKADDAAIDKLHYTLTGSDLFDINPATGQITVAPRETLDADDGTPTVTVMVTATDPWGVGATPSGATTQDVIITINDVNEAPVITVGTTRIPEHAENTAIATVLSTYMATDVDQTDSVDWSVSGTDAGDFEISSTGVLTFKEAPNYEMPADSSRDNVYMVTVVATDAGVDSKNKMTAERAVVITVTNEEETGTVTLTSVQPKIGFPLTASVTDLDGGEMGITWKWQRDATGTADPVTSNCSTVVTEDGWEDAEGMGAKAATYTPEEDDEGKCLRATAMYIDGQGMDDAMGVSVNAVVKDLANRAPEFDDDASYTRTIDENVTPDTAATPNPANVNDPGTTTGSPVTAEDPNGDTLTYSLSGNDAGPFMIGPSDGQISAKMKLDHEAKSSYTVTVTATDPDGLSDSVDVTIKVTNLDEEPEIMRAPDANVAPKFASATTSRTVAEDTAAGEDIGNPVAANDANGDTLAYTLGGTDAASFDIGSATGQLMTLAALDYEAKASYEVTVAASDSGGLSDSIDVTITVTNVDEAGRVTFWRDGADATTAAIMVGDELGGAVDDSDGNPGDTFPIAMYTRIANVTSWQWAKTMTPNMMASWMNLGTGGMYTVMDDDAGYYLRATATYMDGEGMGKTASEKTMMVMMTTMNAAPMFESETDTREVAENTAADTGIGSPVTAMDADNDTLTYSLSGTDMASFDIGSATGQLMTLAALDFETKPTYSVTVTASDSGGLSDSIDVTITVTDVDEDVAPPDPLVDKYDVNKDGEIERSEVFAAINDYLDEGAGAPTRADVFKLIELYLGD